MTIEAIYQSDPVLRFLRQRLRLTPGKVLLLAWGIAALDLLIAGLSGHLYSRDGVIGAFSSSGRIR